MEVERRESGTTRLRVQVPKLILLPSHTPTPFPHQGQQGELGGRAPLLYTYLRRKLLPAAPRCHSAQQQKLEPEDGTLGKSKGKPLDRAKPVKRSS